MFLKNINPMKINSLNLNFAKKYPMRSQKQQVKAMQEAEQDFFSMSKPEQEICINGECETLIENFPEIRDAVRYYSYFDLLKICRNLIAHSSFDTGSGLIYLHKSNDGKVKGGYIDFYDISKEDFTACALSGVNFAKFLMLLKWNTEARELKYTSKNSFDSLINKF